MNWLLRLLERATYRTGVARPRPTHKIPPLASHRCPGVGNCPICRGWTR